LSARRVKSEEANDSIIELSYFKIMIKCSRQEKEILKFMTTQKETRFG
jgi:hypothetical protein